MSGLGCVCGEIFLAGKDNFSWAGEIFYGQMCGGISGEGGIVLRNVRQGEFSIFEFFMDECLGELSGVDEPITM